MWTLCKIFINTIFYLMTEPATCHVVFLVCVEQRRKNVSSRWVYRNEDAEIVGSNPAVINHSSFAKKGKRLPNKRF